jgi:hypothetical protein
MMRHSYIFFSLVVQLGYGNNNSLLAAFRKWVILTLWKKKNYGCWEYFRIRSHILFARQFYPSSIASGRANLKNDLLLSHTVH